METGLIVVENATGREAAVIEYNRNSVPQYLVEFLDDKEQAFMLDEEIHPKTSLSSLLRLEVKGDDVRLIVSDPFKQSVCYYITEEGMQSLDKFLKHYKEVNQ